MEEVVGEIGDKLIRRHPHVFTDPRPLSVEEAGRLWQELKAREKKERGKTGTGPSGGLNGLGISGQDHRLRLRFCRYDATDVWATGFR